MMCSNETNYKLSSDSNDQDHDGKLKCDSTDLGSLPSPSFAKNYRGPHHPLPLSWDEIEDLERRRREILKRLELPAWRVLSYWSGTCLTALGMDCMTYIPITIFCLIRIQARMSSTAPFDVDQLSDTDLDVLGGFLSFLLVLFVNQTNTRFYSMYGLSKKCAGKVQDVAALAVTQLPIDQAQRLIRYMNASHVAGYVGLGGPYSKEIFFDTLNQKHPLLAKHELVWIERQGFDMDAGGATFKELILWCLKIVGKARKSNQIDSIEAAQLQSHILELRASMDGIYDYRDQPVHFFYMHFLCLLSSLYLPLFAVKNAYLAGGWGAVDGDDSTANLKNEILRGLIIVLQSIFVVGLRLLGQIMVDPFGDDLEDLSVLTYVTTTLEHSERLLNTKPDFLYDGDDIGGASADTCAGA